MRDRDERRARLRERVNHWASRLRTEPKVVRIQRMTRKWGSCSLTGIITLAEDLTEQEPEFQDFVIAHELLHLRVRSHGKVFKALMSVHLPGWRQYGLNK
jgi:hypothetical protein